MRKTTKFNEIAPKSKGLVDSEGLQYNVPIAVDTNKF